MSFVVRMKLQFAETTTNTRRFWQEKATERYFTSIQTDQDFM